MLKVIRLLLPIMVSAMVLGCSTTADEKNEINIEPGELDIIICEEPRPQICTREYNPVCATFKDGSSKTGATGCTSCSDPEVVGYRAGACGIVSIEK